MKVNNINWKDFFQAINHPALILDSSHHILAANKASQDYMGLSEKEVVGKKCFKLIHDSSSKAPFCCPLESLLKEGKSETIEMEMEAFGGYALVSCTPILDDDGKLDKIIHIATDITQRKKSEEALRESEERYRLINDSSQDFIYSYDLESRFTFANKSLCDTMGLKLSQIVGKTHTELGFPEEQSLEWDNLNNEVHKTNKTIIALTKTPMPDGEVHDYEVILNPLHDEDGEIIGISGTTRDITQWKESEQKIRDSEKKYRELVKTAAEAIILFDKKGNILEFNQKTLDLTGFESHELIGSNLIKIAPKIKINLKEALSAFKDILMGKKIGKTEWELINRKNNEIKTVVAQYTPLKTDDKISTLVVILEDVTELKAREKSYRDLVNTSQVGIFKSNLQGDVIFANHAMAHMFHYDSVEDLMEENIVRLYKNKEDRLKFLSYLEENGSVTDYEVETVGKDGQNVNVLVSAILEDNVLSGMFMDITDRKMVEKKLEESESQIRAIFNTVRSGIILVDKEGKIDFANQHTMELFGYNISELIGKSYIDLTSIKQRSTAETNMFDLIDGSIDLVNLERLYQRKDESTFWGHLSGTRILNDNGSIKGLIGVITDISDRKKADNALKESLLEKEVLLKEIHHRVKNNLQIISSLLALQEDYVKENPTAVNVLMESQNRVLSMAMIHEMLYQSKDLGSIDFSAYIRNLVSNISGNYGITNVNTVIDVEDVFLNMETSIPLGLVVSELVSNSLKHAFPDKSPGKLTITLQNLNNNFELTVADDGVGFPADVDFRNNESSLGLRLVNSLVNQLNGKIELESENEGLLERPGSKFIITFNELIYKERI